MAQDQWCGTDKKLQELKAANPGFQEHMHKSMLKAATGASWAQQKASLQVPVVVHIIHDNGIGNISDEQVQNALFILNRDYNRQNPDTTQTRNTATAPFKQVASSMDIEFKLAKIDPDGNCTNPTSIYLIKFRSLDVAQLQHVRASTVFQWNGGDVDHQVSSLQKSFLTKQVFDIRDRMVG